MKYYILYKDENRGPLTPAEMEEFDLNPKSRVWAPGWSSWKDAEEVQELMDYMNLRETQAREERESRKRNEEEAKAKKEKEAKAAKEAREQAQARAQAEAEAAAEPEPQQADAQEWYYAINEQQYGPVTEADLRNMGLGPDTLLWNEAFGDQWIPASQVPVFADLFTPVPPAPAPINPVYPTPDTPAEPYFREVEPMSGIYTAGIFGALLAVIAILACIIQGKYCDGKEMLTILAICALPSVILAVSSLSTGAECAKSCKRGDESEAFKKKGLSLGLGIGAIISAVAGIAVAFLEFELV